MVCLTVKRLSALSDKHLLLQLEVGTLDEIRTHTWRFLRPLSLPIGLREHIRLYLVVHIFNYIKFSVFSQDTKSTKNLVMFSFISIALCSCEYIIPHSDYSVNIGNLHKLFLSFLYLLRIFLYFCIYLRYNKCVILH